MNSENAVFGKRIRIQREYQKLSRERLAEFANISTQFLADIESGKKGMTVVTLKKICKALHISSDSIIFGTAYDSRPEINAMLEAVPTDKQQDIEDLIQMIIRLL